MKKSTGVSLSDQLDNFTTAQMTSNWHGPTSEVARAGLRLVESPEDRLTVLRQLIKEGEQSGFADFSFENLVRDLDSQ